MKSIIGLLIAISIVSCKKQLSPQAAASINVVNVAVNADAVKVNSLGGAVIYNGFPDLYYGSNAVFTVPAGNPSISIVLSADTMQTIFNSMVSVQSKGIYSFYLAGQPPKYDCLMLADTIPYRADSTCGVRFINLSSNSNPVTVNLSATPDVQEFPALAYKQISTFKTYQAHNINQVYDFDIRDAVTHDVIATYELYVPLSSNVTLVLMGLIGATDQYTPAITRVNNY